MRKLLLFILIFLLVVSTVVAVTSCKQDVETPVAAEEPKVITYVTVLRDVYYGWNLAHNGFLDACEEYGFIGNVIGPNEVDTAMQLDLMETAIGQGVDAIIAVPLVPESYVDIYNKANDAGILIAEAAVTAGLDLPNVITSGFSDNSLWGVQAADAIAEKTGGEANILAVTTALDTPNQLEARTAFEAHAEDNYPGLKIVQIIESKSDHNIGLEGIKNALTANPEIDFIWANEGFVAQAAATALEELGKKGEVTILGVDLARETMDLIIAGDVWATFDQAFYEAWGYAIVEQFNNYWTDQPVEKIMHVPFVYYDQNNVTDHPSYEEFTQ